MNTDEINPNTTQNNDEISLLDLFAVLLKYKVMIFGITAFAMILAVVISIISLKLPPEKSFLPNKYTSSAHMLINDSKSSGGSLSSMLASSGLGSIASLAGISGGGATYSSLAVYLAKSNQFLDAVVNEFKILEKPELQKSKYPRSDSREMIKKQLSASIDDDTGVFTISFTDIDPSFAQSVVNYSVDWLSERFDQLGIDQNKISKENLETNIALCYEEILRLENEANSVSDKVSKNQYSAWGVPSIALEASKNRMELNAQQEVYKQLKTQYELLKVQMQSETPIFQIIERAEIADKKSAPSRGKLCIIITFAGGFMSVFLAFLLNALHNIKNDPEAMTKLFHGKK